MTTIELTPDELELARSALHSFLDDFGHDEAEIVERIQALLEKLPKEASSPGE